MAAGFLSPVVNPQRVRARARPVAVNTGVWTISVAEYRSILVTALRPGRHRPFRPRCAEPDPAHRRPGEGELRMRPAVAERAAVPVPVLGRFRSTLGSCRESSCLNR